MNRPRSDHGVDTFVDQQAREWSERFPARGTRAAAPLPQRPAARPAEPDSPSGEGETILALPRAENERTRLARKVYQGHGFVDLRVEFLGRDGRWLPTKKGLSLKARDLRELGEALLRLAGGT